jgi:BlaI family transcriptional regulator, penicillinase repressor
VDDALLDLGELERKVMHLVWLRGPLTAQEVGRFLARPLTDSTIRTVLRRLEAKGYVSHTVEDLAFVYRAAEPRTKVAATAVKRIVDWLCNGSVEELLLGMVEHAVLDRRQIQSLARTIEEAKAASAKNNAKMANDGTRKGRSRRKES